MHFGFDTKYFQGKLKKASNSDIEYQIEWSKNDLSLVESGKIIANEDFKSYLKQFILICENELKSRKSL